MLQIASLFRSGDSSVSVHEAQWSVGWLIDMVRQSVEEAWHISLVDVHRGISEAE